MPRKHKDISGTRFNSLTAIHFSHHNKCNYYWLFHCVCGTKKLIDKQSVLRGDVRSCGCLRNKHNGFTTGHPRFYRIWIGMRQRCYYKNQISYKNYGARGINIDWDSFSEFKKYMYAGYLAHCRKYGEANTTIERVDNNGNYSKENCVWATYKEQSLNRRNSYLLTYNGQSKSIADWAKELKINRFTIYQRLHRGWAIEKVLSII
jgi:hypothetical protein